MRAASCLLALLLGLGGCASREVVFRTLPDDTPAANHALDLQRAEALVTEAAEGGKQSVPDAPPPITAAEAPSMKTYDPWARLNRFTYRFNARFDDTLFLPVANHYRRLPAPLRSGVHNFFANLGEVTNVLNYTLQGRLGRGVRSVGRFAINSTIGIGGLIDVAAHLRLPPAPTGFGTTLAKWGMHPGAYWVIPVLGPSTLREGIGLAADYATTYTVNLADLYRGNKSLALAGLNAVDQRANVGFRYYQTGSPFEYEMVRFLYVRKLLIEDAKLHPAAKRDPDMAAGE